MSDMVSLSSNERGKLLESMKSFSRCNRLLCLVCSAPKLCRSHSKAIDPNRNPNRCKALQSVQLSPQSIQSIQLLSINGHYVKFGCIHRCILGPKSSGSTNYKWHQLTEVKSTVFHRNTFNNLTPSFHSGPQYRSTYAGTSVSMYERMYAVTCSVESFLSSFSLHLWSPCHCVCRLV